MMIASPAVTASRWNWVPAGRPRTSPGTGSTTEIAGAPTRNARRGAQRLQQRHGPEWFISGQGRPVLPAATAS